MDIIETPNYRFNTKDVEVPDAIIKLVIVGDANVGKTSLLKKISENTFGNNTEATVGVDFVFLTTHIKGVGKIRINIWDTAGQERFSSITSSYYSGADGFLLTCSDTDITSCDNLVTKWNSQIKIHLKENIDVVYTIIVNKCDDVSKSYNTKNNLSELSKTLNSDIFFCSAKNDSIDKIGIPFSNILNKLISNESILKRCKEKLVYHKKSDVVNLNSKPVQDESICECVL